MLDDTPRASQATRSPKKRVVTNKGSSVKRVKFTGLTPHSKYPNMSLRVVPDAHSCVSRLVGSARPYPCVTRNPWNTSEFVGWSAPAVGALCLCLFGGGGVFVTPRPSLFV
jgi:hypothetical protein